VDYCFDREEEVMRSMSYPDLETYIIGHQELAATVHEYAKLYRNDPGAISRKEVL
jgi:hemerythrin